MAQRGGNERYHAHDRQQDDGPCSGREWPQGRGDARRVGCVARAGGSGVAVAPADTLPLLDAAPAQPRSGSPLRVWFVNSVPPSLVLDWSGGCLPIFGDESTQHHFAYVHSKEALSVGR